VAAAPPVAADDAAEAQPGAGAPDDSGNTSAVKKADSNSMPDLKASGGEEGVDSDETDADADAEDAASIQPEPDDEAVGDAHGETLAEGGVDTVEADAAGGAKPAPGGGAAASRLGKGALRAMVQAHLRENPGRAWTPTAISKVLGRSAGAINNACVKLTEDGAVTTFEDKPIRFQWNSDASADAS